MRMLFKGVTGGQQLLRAVSGRSGLVTEEKVLRLLLRHAPDHGGKINYYLFIVNEEALKINNKSMYISL